MANKKRGSKGSRNATNELVPLGADEGGRRVTVTSAPSGSLDAQREYLRSQVGTRLIDAIDKYIDIRDNAESQDTAIRAQQRIDSILGYDAPKTSEQSNDDGKLVASVLGIVSTIALNYAISQAQTSADS